MSPSASVPPTAGHACEAPQRARGVLCMRDVCKIQKARKKARSDTNCSPHAYMVDSYSRLDEQPLSRLPNDDDAASASKLIAAMANLDVRVRQLEAHQMTCALSTVAAAHACGTSSQPETAAVAASRRSTTDDSSTADINALEVGSWTTAQVAQWLDSIGLGSDVIGIFMKHQITGDVLLGDLGADELREMGMELVGPRMHLLRSLKQLQRSVQQRRRDETRWTAAEERYGCFVPLDVLADYVGSCCCPDKPDTYTLSVDSLLVSSTVYPMGNQLRCCAKSTSLNTIDLSMVTDVDAASEQSCCSGRDRVVLSTRDSDDVTLTLKLGSAPAVVEIFREAIEAQQGLDARLSS